MSELKIIEMPIDQLIEADYNPRKLSEKQYRDLEVSLKTFGMVDPVIVNTHPERNNVIVGGHQRVKVWEGLGNKTISCVQVYLDLKQERELNVRLNNDFLQEVGFTRAMIKKAPTLFSMNGMNKMKSYLSKKGIKYITGYFSNNRKNYFYFKM